MSTRIKQLREEFHMTQVRLSTELEVSQETVSAYESGKHYPSVDILIKLTKIFHTNCDYILNLSDVRNTTNRNALSQQEMLLIDKYNRLPKNKQECLKAYLDGLSE